LGETGHNQIGNYTLTVTDSDFHSFTETINGATTSYTSSSSISCTTYGTFSLAGGNPYLPYGGNVGQAGGAGVGIQTQWYSRTTGASEGGTNGQGAGSNRVTNSLPRIQGERLEPNWTSGAAGASSDSGIMLLPDFGGPQAPMQLLPDFGQQNVFQLLPYFPVPPGSGDDPNLGLPVGPTGIPGLSNNGGFSWGQFANGILSLLVPALNPPQPSPNNGPYQLSTEEYVETCLCEGIVSVPYEPYLLGAGGNFPARTEQGTDNWIDWNKIRQNVEEVGFTARLIGGDPIARYQFLRQISQLDAQGRADVGNALLEAPGNVLSGVWRRTKGILTTTVDDVWNQVSDFASDPLGYVKGVAVDNLRHFQEDPADFSTGVSFNAGTAALGGVALKGLRIFSKSLKKKWAKKYGKVWPEDPATGNDMDLSHKRALADRGSNNLRNIEPLPHAEHMKRHMDAGDFKRWRKRRRRCL
jgi:hypothetical protein